MWMLGLVFLGLVLYGLGVANVMYTEWKFGKEREEYTNRKD